MIVLTFFFNHAVERVHEQKGAWPTNGVAHQFLITPSSVGLNSQGQEDDGDDDVVPVSSQYPDHDLPHKENGPSTPRRTVTTDGGSSFYNAKRPQAAS